MSVEFQFDVTKYYYKYFPTKNGVVPKLELNKNFTNETLKYISKPWAAKYIANVIKEFTKGKHYFLFEFCAGIGGNTLEFLSRPEVSMTISYEKEKSRAEMLKRNISAYDYGYKAIVLNDMIKGLDSDFEDLQNYKNAIFFMDPPWLPETLKQAKTDYRQQYITEGMKVGALTLEQWLEGLKNIAYMVVFKVPPKYKLKPVSGWTYNKSVITNSKKKNIDDKHGLLYVCVNNLYIDGGVVNKFGGFMNKDNILRKMLPLSENLAHMYENFVQECNSKPFEEAREDSVCQKFVKYSTTSSLSS